MWAPNNAGGVSEEIIVRWLKATGNRDRVLVATKVRGAMGQNFSEGDDHPLQREGLSRRWILRVCADSLRRLQVDYIDLYQAHFIDPRTPIEETLSAFTDLVRKGYVSDSIGAADLVLAAEEIEEISNVVHWEKSRTEREA